jgi:hypothetical protein
MDLDVCHITSSERDVKGVERRRREWKRERKRMRPVIAET